MQVVLAVKVWLHSWSTRHTAGTKHYIAASSEPQVLPLLLLPLL
jgi:hypothetical protein